MTLKELFETRGQGRTKHEHIRRMADNIRRRFLKPGQTVSDKHLLCQVCMTYETEWCFADTFACNSRLN